MWNGDCDISSNVYDVNIITFCLPDTRVFYFFCSERGTSLRGAPSHFTMRRKFHMSCFVTSSLHVMQTLYSRSVRQQDAIHTLKKCFVIKNPSLCQRVRWNFTRWAHIGVKRCNLHCYSTYTLCAASLSDVEVWDIFEVPFASSDVVFLFQI